MGRRKAGLLKGRKMAKIATSFFENIIDGDSAYWIGIRERPETQTQCLAAIVVLLAEIADELKEQSVDREAANAKE